MRLTRCLAAAGLVLSALSPPVLSAQHTRAFDRIGLERGLSNASVTAIVQGRFGYLTIGTQDGLNIYDGVSFEVFRPIPGDTTSLADGWITALAISRTGPIWIGTLQGGVHRSRPPGNGFQRLRHRPYDASSLSSDRVNALLEGADGTLWVGTAAGLDAVDTATGRARRFAPEPAGDSALLKNDVLAIAEIDARRLWIGTRLGVYMFDRASERFEVLTLPLRTRNVSAMLVADTLVWIGTPDDLVAVDPLTRNVRYRYRRGARSPIAHGVNVLVRGAGDTLWIGGDRGVVALDTRSGQFVDYPPRPTDPRGFPGSIARALLVDRGGVLWAGFESHGLAKHAPSAIHFGLLRDGGPPGTSLSDVYVRGITQDPAGNIWVGTQAGGLNRIDARTRRVTAYRHDPSRPRSLPADNVWATLVDRRGVMWVGLHTAGLGTFDPRTGNFTRSRFVPRDGSVNVLLEDRAGALLVGLEGRGLHIVDPDRRAVTSYGATLGDHRVLASNDVQAILEDRLGRLWVGGAEGLSRRDATGEWRRFPGPNGPGSLASNFVTNIVEDSKGRIWVATKGGGLNRYDETGGTFTAAGTAQGLPHNFIYGVLEDARGHLWLSSDDGLAMYDPDQAFVIRYGLEDGLQAREFNRRAHLRASDGTMYFGGINGLNHFDPGVVTRRAEPPVVALARLHTRSGVRSAARLTADSTVVVPGASPLRIVFAALDYTAPEKIQFAYRLEGVDDEWVMSGSRREANYASLPVGRHLFRVIAVSPSGVWNREGAAFTLVVAPPWWATWWARAAQLLLLVGAAAGAVRLRVGAVRRRNAQALLEMTATVPGALFQLQENAQGARAFHFVSRGVADLFPDAASAPADPTRAMELLVSRVEPGDRAILESLLDDSRRTLTGWRTELRWMPAEGGEHRWLSVHARVSRTDTGVAWTGLMADATEARRAEADRIALESRMQQTQKSESLTVLAGGIAHDFNNVLVSVLVGAELLEAQVGGNHTALDTIRRIRSAGQRAAELTQQILAYAGKARPGSQRLDLASLTREMIPLVRATVPRSVAIEVTDGPMPAIVECDPTQMRQVVMNLVTNAGEAIGAKAGTISVRVDVDPRVKRELQLMHASLAMPASGPYVLLEVADDGCGMDAALLQRIFDPFFTTKFTGRGLGLAALLGIVRAHRGALNVQTAPGSGTRFSIYFPLAAGAADLRPPYVSGEQYAARRRGARVLVVDDEEDVRGTTRSLLERLGYDVLTAEDGEAAVALSGASDGIDAFLIDVMMPGMSGPATARALRSRGYAAPIILMSGYAHDDLTSRGLTVDADGFLKKPFQAAALGALLRDALAPRPVSR